MQIKENCQQLNQAVQPYENVSSLKNRRKFKQFQSLKIKGLELDISSLKKTTSSKIIADENKLIQIDQEKSQQSLSSIITRSTSETQSVNFSNKFFEKYELHQKLGQGANGVVYKCTKKDGSGQYAAKQTKCEAQQVLFMKNSYHAIKMLSHESIIKYKSIYITSRLNKAYLLMEWFPHAELSKAKLNQGEIKKISYKILDAIDYMHKAGICHRDIKPQNILYDEKSGKIKIIDFGVSSEIKNGKLKKDMMTSTGTLYYKAPQLFRGGCYDELVDEWAAGVTIYKLIAGVTPFQSDYINETIQNIEKGTLQFKQPIWKQYDPMIKDLIRGLLAPRNKRITAAEAKKNLWFPCYNVLDQNIFSSQKKRRVTLQNVKEQCFDVSAKSLTRSLKLAAYNMKKKNYYQSDCYISDNEQQFRNEKFFSDNATTVSSGYRSEEQDELPHQQFLVNDECFF